MEKMIVNRLMGLIDVLSIESKLELLFKLTETLKLDVKSKPKSNKEHLLRELYGAWSDEEDSLLDDIMEARTVSTKDINLD